MEDLLENISKNSNPKDNFYIVVNDTESRIKKTFSPPLTGKGYEVALIGLCTYYSYPNVDEYNNTILLEIIKIMIEIKKSKKLSNYLEDITNWMRYMKVL